jgi:ribulose-5-phosphate 4-epimerase/fuculose-1-phosphate aldolase
MAQGLQKARPAAPSCSAVEWRTRVDLAACYRLADHYQLGKIIWNHITARVPDDPDKLLVFRLGQRYDEVTASSLLKISLDGKVDDDGAANPAALAEAINYTAYVIHGPMYRARPDVMAVMHTHTRGGQGVAALKCGLLPISQEALLAYGDIAYHPYEGISDDAAESERLARNLGDKNHMILRNHGLITVGKDIPEMFWRMFQLERACAIQMDVLATGYEMDLPSPELCEQARRQHMEWRPGYYEWPALLRLLDERSPGYKA